MCIYNIYAHSPFSFFIPRNVFLPNRDSRQDPQSLGQSRKETIFKDSSLGRKQEIAGSWRKQSMMESLGRKQKLALRWFMQKRELSAFNLNVYYNPSMKSIQGYIVLLFRLYVYVCKHFFLSEISQEPL